MNNLTLFHSDKHVLISWLSKSGVDALLSNRNKKRFNIVLTGGKSGFEIANSLVKYLNHPKSLCYLKKSEFHFWLSDERFVEENSIHKNDRLIADALEKLSTQYKAFFYPLVTSTGISLEDSREFYRCKIIEKVSDDMFDLVVLSLADDGHVASIFNSWNAIEKTDQIVEITTSPHAETPLRLSLSLQKLAKTKKLLILAYSKSPDLEKMQFLQTPSSTLSKLISLTSCKETKSSVEIFTNERVAG